MKELFPEPGESSSLLMSKELYDEVDLDDDAKRLVKERSKVVVFKTKDKKDGTPDVILAPLRAIGVSSDNDTEDRLLTIEVEAHEVQALEFLIALRNDEIGIHGIDIHWKDDVIVVFEEKEDNYRIKKANIYDISVESETSTLVIVLYDVMC